MPEAPATAAQRRPVPAVDIPAAAEVLGEFLNANPDTFVLTGAGCSTASGIPDYRNAAGEWKGAQPVQFRDFTGSAATRQRYWARSLRGWSLMADAQPNRAHRALASLETRGYLSTVLTQNVDGLHQRAGSSEVIDLHGRIDAVVCLGCRRRSSRATMQRRLEASNPAWTTVAARAAPDGDAHIDDTGYERFVVPDCDHCGGILKPAVVFFGESVPPDVVARARARLAASSAMLIVGSSLMVYSGFRFLRQAHADGIPVAAVNIGRIRGAEHLHLQIEADCSAVLAALESRLAG